MQKQNLQNLCVFCLFYTPTKRPGKILLVEGLISEHFKRKIKEVRVIHQHKLEALEDLVEAANGQPVLIAYWFKHDRQRIIEHLESIGYRFGKNLRDIKDSDDIKLWNAGQLPVAMIHPASAGHGLNIQSGGHILIWYGLTWSLELYQQTNARLWRQGQTQTVTIHHIVTKNTVDEDVLAALASKDVTQEKLIAAVKARL